MNFMKIGYGELGNIRSLTFALTVATGGGDDSALA